MISFLIFTLAVKVAITFAADPCGNDASQTYISLAAYITQLQSNYFNNSKINANCVSSAQDCHPSPPNNVCPFNSDQSVNQAGVNQLSTSINNCFSSISDLCGIPIGTFNFPAFTIQSPGSNIILCASQNGAQRGSLGSTTFTIVSSTGNPESLTFQASNSDLRYEGNFTLQNGANNPLEQLTMEASASYSFKIQINPNGVPPYSIQSQTFNPNISPSPNNNYGIGNTFIQALINAGVSANFGNLFGAYLYFYIQNYLVHCQPGTSNS